MLSGWGVGVSRRRRLHPCHAASVGFGATPQGVNKPLGGRVVGGMCQRHSFKGLSFYSYEQPGTRCSEYTLKFAAWWHWLIASPIATMPPCYLTTFKCSCSASLWPLAEPFQPKLGLSL